MGCQGVQQPWDVDTLESLVPPKEDLSAGLVGW